MLQALEVDQGQGYYFAKPLDPEAAEKVLQNASAFPAAPAAPASSLPPAA